MVEVRAATHADVPAMVALIAAVAAEGRWIATESPVDRERLERRFIEAIDSAQGHVLVATDDGVVVGNLGLHPTVFGVLGIGMSVAATHRGQGVGSVMLAAAVEWARQRSDVHKLELEVWPHNTTAQGLYTKFGFNVEGCRRRHYRRLNGELWDVLVMGLVLDETSPGPP